MSGTSDHGLGEPIAATFSLNDRCYSLSTRPVVVICADGCEDEYLSTSLAQVRIPHLAAAAKAGRKVAMVTTKNKLLSIFSHDLEGIAFPLEFASQAKESPHAIGNIEALVGLPTPPIYSGPAFL